MLKLEFLTGSWHFLKELGLEGVDTAMNLFDKWDARGTGLLNKAQYLRLMQQVKELTKTGTKVATLKPKFYLLLQVIGANKFARGPIFQRVVELSFDYVNSTKTGSLDRRQFLVAYNILLTNERKQMALLLTRDFPGYQRRT